jgi:hypothetical protein
MARRVAGASAALPVPCRTENSSRVTPDPRHTAPFTSKGSRRDARDSFRFIATSTNAMTPRGRLIEKIERQPKERVMAAPRSGPRRLAVPQRVLKSPCTLARSRTL